MTRFARADGSKGSNKRQVEEATTWSEMVAQRGKKKKKEVNTSNTDGGNVEENVQMNEKDVKLNSETKIIIDKQDDNEVCRNNNNQSDSTNENANLSPKKKKKGTSEIVNSTEELISDDVCKSSNQQNDLNIETVEQSNTTLSNDNVEQIVDNKDFKENKKTKKRKRNKDKNIEIGDKPLFEINDKGERVKLFKDGSKKTFFDLPYEDGERMTRHDGFWVKTEAVVKLLDLKQSLETDGTDAHTISKKMMKAKRTAHKELRIELIYEQKAILKAETGGDINDHTNNKNKSQKDKLKSGKNKKGNNDKTKNPSVKGKQKKKNQNKENGGVDQSDAVINKGPKETFDLKYEENEKMTEFEGYWVRKQSLPKLRAMKYICRKKIIEARTDGNVDRELSEEEGILYARGLKKEKRNESRKLKIDLIKRAKGQSFAVEPEEYEYFERFERKPARILGIEYIESDKMTKFDGFWVKKEAAVRLRELKERLETEGVTKEEIDVVMKKERRKEEKALKMDNKIVCFNCRESGHMVANCPNVATGANAMVQGVCFKCGSTEHKAFECPSKSKGGASEYAHATCFVCKETGHIARECPDNPKGLYPHGGGCRVCGSVEHLAKDCPDTQVENEGQTLKLGTIDGENVEALDHSLDDLSFSGSRYDQVSTSKKSKKIIFE